MDKFERTASKYMGCLVRAATYSDNAGKEGRVIGWEKGARGNGIWLKCQHESCVFYVYRPVK